MIADKLNNLNGQLSVAGNFLIFSLNLFTEKIDKYHRSTLNIKKKRIFFEETHKIDNFLFFGGLQVHWPAFNCRKYLISPNVMMHDLNRDCKYLSPNIN